MTALSKTRAPARRARAAGRPAAGVAGAIVLGLLVAACSAVPDWADPSDWFEPDEAPTQLSVAQDAAQTQAAEFPNLASVPDARPEATPAQTRERIRESLAADRANAAYTGERLVGGAAQAAAAPAGAPPAPRIGRELTTRTAEPEIPAPAPRATQGAQTAAQETVEPAEPAAPPAPRTDMRFAQFQTGAQPAPQARAARRELVGIIYFAHGSAALDANDRAVLRDIVALHRQRGGSIRVVGHASARTGPADPVRHRMANFEISQLRANAVAAEIVALGAERDKVRAEARADTQPVYHEFMPTGEAGNRRAEIFLEY